MLPSPTSSSSAVDSPADPKSPRDRWLLRAGIVGAALAFLGLSLLASLAIQPFLPADESPNAGYALSAVEGRLPRINEPVVAELPGQRRMALQYVAYHPPLYYLLAGVPLRLGLRAGHPMLGFYAARLLTVLLAVGMVALTGVLAAILARRRGPAVAVGAAALMATSGMLVLTSAVIHNDGFATALIAAELVTTVLVLRRGLRTGVCLLLIASAALGLLTRISALSIVALSAAALVAAGLLHPVGGRRRGLLRGVAWAGALTAACALTSGWYYWRNMQLYGDPTAQAYTADLLRALGDNRPQPPSFAQFILDPDAYGRQVLRMFGAYAANGLSVAVVSPARWAIAAIWLAVAAGIVALGIRRLRAGRWPAADHRLLVGSAVAALLALQVVAIFLEIANHVVQGGAANARYLVPAWPVIVALMAHAIASLPGRLGRALLALAVAAQAALTVALIAAQAARWTGGSGLLAQVPEAVRLSDVPAPDIILALLAVLVIGGLGAAIAAILLGGRHAPGGAAPADGVRGRRPMSVPSGADRPAVVAPAPGAGGAAPPA
jgi:hypothetical protein